MSARPPSPRTTTGLNGQANVPSRLPSPYRGRSYSAGSSPPTARRPSSKQTATPAASPAVLRYLRQAASPADRHQADYPAFLRQADLPAVPSPLHHQTACANPTNKPTPEAPFSDAMQRLSTTYSPQPSLPTTVKQPNQPYTPSSHPSATPISSAAVPPLTTSTSASASNCASTASSVTTHPSATAFASVSSRSSAVPNSTAAPALAPAPAFTTTTNPSAYGFIDPSLAARRAIDRLRQRSDEPSEYINTYSHHNARITDRPEDDRIYFFITGLSSPLRRLIVPRAPATLQTAIDLTVSHAAFLSIARPTRHRNPAASHHRATALFNLPHRGPHNIGVSAETRARHHRKDLCMRCGSRTHQKDTCPLLGQPPRQRSPFPHAKTAAFAVPSSPRPSRSASASQRLRPASPDIGNPSRR